MAFAWGESEVFYLHFVQIYRTPRIGGELRARRFVVLALKTFSLVFSPEPLPLFESPYLRYDLSLRGEPRERLADDDHG
jgi:hypothetical protein